MNKNRVNQNSEECSITHSGGGDVPAEVGVRVRSSWSRDAARPPDWRLHRCVSTQYTETTYVAVASIGPVPPLQRDTSSIMTSIYIIFGIEGAILVLSNNDESLEETNMNKNL